MGEKAIIIGAGPAGLTAGLEFLRRSDIVPTILETTEEIGGLSRTTQYKGNRMDIGGHRFFSKSDRVMQWWMDLMPLESPTSDKRSPDPSRQDEQASIQRTETLEISYRGDRRVVNPPVHQSAELLLARAGPPFRGVTEDQSKVGWIRCNPDTALMEGTDPVTAPDSDSDDLVMLVRPRRSRIYYQRKFFDYPVTLTAETARNLGLLRILRIGTSYTASRFQRKRPEKSLEDFLINRFGRELYCTFFKSYTEKVWGRPCGEISADWGTQRIKGLSLTTAIHHFVKTLFRGTNNDTAQKDTETSLIERFLYPKFGPGQLWEHVAKLIREKGGEIHMGWKVDKLNFCDRTALRISSIEAVRDDGQRRTFYGDHFFSTMPMRELVRAMDTNVPAKVLEVSDGLPYRDFITVGLLLHRLKVNDSDGGPLRDTWIYVHEPDVLLGRVQIFNNWSRHLVSDPTKVWIGLEYFCYESDDLWIMPDEDLRAFAIAEAAKIGLLDPKEVIDGHVIRMPKSYPAYFGTYGRFDELRNFTDRIENLFLIGRNGMHKYNNQDHSMLTAMHTVDGIIAGKVDKRALWGINAEQDYHEKKV